MTKVYLGLLHYPIYNKNNEVITTAITNFDIHDIARSAKSYAISRYFVIHPLDSQIELVNEILNYWLYGYGANYNQDRHDALSIVEIVRTVNECVNQIIIETGKKPIIVTTDARTFDNSISYHKLRNLIDTDDKPCLLLFGTGWGIERSVMEQFDYILEPIVGRGEYNHLCVRAAVSIILDRLLGECWWKNKE